MIVLKIIRTTEQNSSEMVPIISNDVYSFLRLWTERGAGFRRGQVNRDLSLSDTVENPSHIAFQFF